MRPYAWLHHSRPTTPRIIMWEGSPDNWKTLGLLAELLNETYTVSLTDSNVPIIKTVGGDIHVQKGQYIVASTTEGFLVVEAHVINAIVDALAIGGGIA